MGLTIVFSEVAKEDLKNIYTYIKRDSAVYARKEIISIRLATMKLATNAFLGKKFESFDNENIRELIFKNYRVIYEITESTLVILTIHHHARLLSNNPALSDDSL